MNPITGCECRHEVLSSCLTAVRIFCGQACIMQGTLGCSLVLKGSASFPWKCKNYLQPDVTLHLTSCNCAAYFHNVGNDSMKSKPYSGYHTSASICRHARSSTAFLQIRAIDGSKSRHSTAQDLSWTWWARRESHTRRTGTCPTIRSASFLRLVLCMGRAR
jgi:hypothetical protein